MSTRLLKVFLNNQELNVSVEGVYGFYRKDDETVTLYRGNIVGRKYIVLEGMLYAIDSQINVKLNGTE